jgi:predicted RecA/RadA family phage recombinase
MATAKFIHDGDSIDYTPGSNVAAGDVVVQADLVGVAKRDIVANTLGALAVTGVFDVPKASGADTAIPAGAMVYWNATTQQATTTASGNTYLGKATKSAANGDATVRVRLDQ